MGQLSLRLHVLLLPLGVRPRGIASGAIDIGNFGHADVLSTFGGSKKGGGGLFNK